MVSKHLSRINREVDRIWKSNGGAASWDGPTLERLNADLHRVIAEAAGQLEEWNVELDAREELQRRMLAALPESDRIRELWWNEQRTFYTDLLERMYAYFNYDETAVVTFSINALEVLLLVRLLVEEGVLRTETLQPIFRYLSRYGRTERYDKLSSDSLKKRYSLRHDGSRKKVKQLLLNLVRRIDQEPPRG